jgi:Eukaryotic aspartyl protease
LLLGTLCGQPCDNQIKFDPTKSSTFVDEGTQLSVSFITGVGVDPVVNNDYTLDLRNGSDTVRIAGFTLPNTSLFLITNQTAKFSGDTFSGIFGEPKTETKLPKILIVF